jgi:leucyl-tRNA---protein transferase
MLILHKFTTDPHACAYLPGQAATLEYRYVAALEPEEYEDLLNRGYRKFGATLFRAVCGKCQECRPLRVPVDRFRPSRSQARALQRNRNLLVRIGEPVADAARVELYNRYHQERTRHKGWAPHGTDVEEYESSFLGSPIPSVEISAWDGDALRAVVLTDVTPHVVSAVYHFYDPALLRQSLGAFCVLQAIELARRLKKQWVHLGFYVAGSGSMSYKGRFRPCEIMDAAGVWRDA